MYSIYRADNGEVVKRNISDAELHALQSQYGDFFNFFRVVREGRIYVH
jgi:hypothetical protein